MGKSKQNRNGQTNPTKLNIEEPDFGVKKEADQDQATELEKLKLTPADRKLLAQQERDRKDAEEAARMKKAKQQQEAEKKKKNKKTKTKQQTSCQSKNTEEPKYTEEPPEYDETPKTKLDEECEVKQEMGDGDWTNWRDPNSDNISFDNRRRVNYPDSASSSYIYNLNDGRKDYEFQQFIKSAKRSNGLVREEKGDLFNAPHDYSLAHCVAEDFSMGAGIAKEFKAKFKGVSKLLDQNASTGGLAFLTEPTRFIYYLVTKKVSRGKPTLYTLWQSLLKLKDHIVKHQVTKLAIPQIGCGLDRLNWSDVKGMLEYIFNGIDIEIVVYILEFNAEETATPSRTPRKCNVVHATRPLIEIVPGTGLIFFGTEKGDVSNEMECLAEKYDYINDYKTMQKTTGDVVKIVNRGEYLYGLIIRRTITDRIDFGDFERCLFTLRKMLKNDQTVYIGLQGFVEKGDEVVTDKLIGLMQYVLQDVEIWVCWPKELAHMCPVQKQINK